MPRQRTACYKCASIKVACSQGEPCRRCEQTNDGGVRRRTRHQRSRHGCLNCLQRRKKCDESLPVCEECGRLGLPNCRPRRDESLLQSINLVQDRAFLEHGSQYSPKTGSGSWLKQRIENSAGFNVSEYLSQVALLPEGSLVGTIRHGDLSESSALESRPDASSHPEEEPPAMNIISSVGTIYMSQANMASFDPTEQHLLLHYIQHVSRALVVVNDDENPFLNDFVPVAIEVKSVRHAMLALSACHLCKVYPKFEDTLIRQHSLALHYLVIDLQSQDKIAHTLITSLLLCLLGICHGTSSKWILHLYGAKALIDSHLQHALIPPPSQSAIDLYDLICCKTRLTCNKVPTARGNYALTPYGGEPHSIHPLFGLARDLYQVLDSIEQLIAEKAISHIPAPVDGFPSVEAREIQQYLQKWTTPTQVRDSSPQLTRDSIMAAEAIRWAAILRLNQVMAWEASEQASQQSAVQNILDAISRIPSGSPANAQLLIPLFLAGVTARRKTQRLQVEYRISILESIIGMGNIASVHRFLDLVWKHGRETNFKWEVMFQRDYPYAVLY
ncbi:unnamed protein product [Penicillium glandicola]